jgi:hypothetical protein
MPQKPKEEKEKKTPEEEAGESQPQPQPSPARQELNREQLEDLRRKLQKKFH